MLISAVDIRYQYPGKRTWKIARQSTERETAMSGGAKQLSKPKWPDSKGVSKVPLAYLLLSLLVLHFKLYGHPLTLIFVKRSIGG